MALTSSRSGRFRASGACATVLLLGSCLCAAYASAAPAQDAAPVDTLLVFPSARGVSRFDAELPLRHADRAEGIVDALYVHDRGPVRLVAELSAGTDHAQVDRLQFGREVAANTIVWLGITHSPASAWNFGRDLGNYLLTTISTPSIEAWASDSGVLARSTTGVLVDSTIRTDGSAGVVLETAAGVVHNPVATSQNAYVRAPFDDQGHRLSVSARLGYRPDIVGTDEGGLILARHELVAADLVNVGHFDARAITDLVVGIYANGSRDAWTARGAVYDFRLSLSETARERTESFVAGYLQIEHSIDNQWTPYIRHEDSARAEDSTYLRAARQRFTVRRSICGVRWDPVRHHAFTIELARATTLSNRYSSVAVQWSAVFP